MLILSLLQDPLSFVGFILALLLAITVHEASHAYIALRLGDDTAKQAGRITLNPIAHLDPIGTLFLFLVGFGWGRPVPINPSNFKKPIKDEVLVSLAGPAANLILAAFLGLIVRFIPLGHQLFIIIGTIILINLILMIFNLLPIPPLDGSKILRIFIPEETYIIFQRLGMPILFGLLFFSAFFYPIIPKIINFVIDKLFFLLTGNYFNY